MKGSNLQGRTFEGCKRHPTMKSHMAHRIEEFLGELAASIEG